MEENNETRNSKGTKALRLKEVTCPICFYILIEPVVTPCNHAFCYDCIVEGIKKVSLHCPLCKKRLAIWARRNSKKQTLVDHRLWQEIQAAFPKRVASRLRGEEDYYDEDETETEVWCNFNLAQPGEIAKELFEQQEKQDAEMRKKQEEEEAASNELIEAIQRREEQERLDIERRALRDEALAREVYDAINQADKTPTQRSGPKNANSNGKTKRTLLDRFVSRGPVKIDKTGRTKKEDKDAYPYRCISPWEKDVTVKKEPPSAAPARPPSTFSDIFISSPSSSRDSTLSYVYVDSKPPSRTTNKSASPVDDTGIGSQLEVAGSSRPGSRTSSRDAAESLLVAMSSASDNENEAAGVQRGASAMSGDSISGEITHFKPIKSCPKTPPRRLPSGQLVEAPLVRSTPRNLSGGPSPAGGDIETPSQETVAVGSPIVKRRLEKLAAERKNKVAAMSKSTDTSNVFDGIGFEHSYSSPGKKNTPSFTTSRTTASTVSMRQLCRKSRKSAVSTVSSSTAVVNSNATDINNSYDAVRKIQFDYPTVRDAGRVPGSPEHSNPPLLPLEANLDDDSETDFPEAFLSALSIPPPRTPSPAMPRLQRYDGRHAPDATPDNPPELPATNRPDVKNPANKVKNKKKTPEKKSNTNILESKVTESNASVKEYFEKETSVKENGDQSRCARDLMGVTDRPKEGSPGQPQMELEYQLRRETAETSQSQMIDVSKRIIAAKVNCSKQGMKSNEIRNSRKISAVKRSTVCSEEQDKVSSQKLIVAKKSIDRASKLKRKKTPGKLGKQTTLKMAVNGKTKKEKRAPVSGVFESQVSTKEKVSRWLDSDKSSSDSDPTEDQPPVPFSAESPLKFNADATNGRSPRKSKNPSGKHLEQAHPLSPRPSDLKQSISSPKSSRPAVPATPPPRERSVRHRSPKKHFAIEEYDTSSFSRNRPLSGVNIERPIASLGQKAASLRLDSDGLESEGEKSTNKGEVTATFTNSGKPRESSRSGVSDCDSAKSHNTKAKKKKSAKSLESEHFVSSEVEQLVSSDVSTSALLDEVQLSGFGDKRAKKCSGKSKKLRESKRETASSVSCTSEYESATDVINSAKRAKKAERTRGNKTVENSISAGKAAVKSVAQCTNNKLTDESPKRVSNRERNHPEFTPTDDGKTTVISRGPVARVFTDVNSVEFSPSDDGKRPKKRRYIDRNDDENDPPANMKKSKQAKLDFGQTNEEEEETGVLIQKLNPDHAIEGPVTQKRKPGLNKSKAGAKGKGRGRRTKTLPAGQPTLDAMLRRSNFRTSKSAAASDTLSTTSVTSEPLERSDFNTEEEYNQYLVERDERLAQKLQWEEDMIHRHRLTAVRFKGSEDGYSLRKQNSKD